LIGKAVLVTRAARRMGEAIVRELFAVRADSALCLQADLRASVAPGLFVDRSVVHFGRLDGLVNNTSIFFATLLGAIDETAWDDLVGSNFKVPLFLMQVTAPCSTSQTFARSGR
jgi:pteridine reductase